MTETEAVRWQELMDSAYAEWQGKDWTYEQFLSHLTVREREAVLLGNLNCQVCNGGFSQWVYNGYATSGRAVVNLLRDIDTETARKLADRIENLLRFVDLRQSNRGIAGDYWKGPKRYNDEYDDGPTAGEVAASEMDGWYYNEIQPKLIAEVESFLSRP